MSFETYATGLQTPSRLKYIITGEPQRAHRYDYPLDAIREIVLNMIVHRDYRDSSDSVIKIFDDRMEFYNLGGLYDDLTVEQLITNAENLGNGAPAK